MIDTANLNALWLNYQLLGLIAAIVVFAALFPSCWQQLRHKDLTATSTIKLLLLVIGSLLWIMYGFRDSSPAVVLSAAISFAITSILLLIKLRSTHTHDQ